MVKENEDVLIGRIMTCLHNEIVITVFSGHLEGPWDEVLQGNKQMALTVPKTAVCSNCFTLTRSKCLPNYIKVLVRTHL